MRCLACDICPTHVAVDEEYRCIIKSKNDDFKDLHLSLLDSDAIIPVVYSPVNRGNVKSNYQSFIERSRYLRRGDYVFSDVISAPIIIEEIGSQEHMDMRTITSLIRHHTIISKPIIAYEHSLSVLNETEVADGVKSLFKTIELVAKGRLVSYSQQTEHLKYNPVGYVLSTAKDQEDEKLGKRKDMIEKRDAKIVAGKKSRLK
jgi:multimeric flavodoxin WrbA